MNVVAGTLLSAGRSTLSGSSPSAGLDVEILLAHVLGISHSQLLAHPEREIPDDKQKQFLRLIRLRCAGQPIAYLTGEREFWSLPLKATPATLIPRPETELLVEQALHYLPQSAAVAILDLGTGSGAVALALATERPHSTVVATDLSEAALEIARQNAAALHVRNVQFVHGDWFAPVSGRRFRIIVSNPPYVAEGDPHLRAGDLRFEPGQALIGGLDGLAAIRQIVRHAPNHLEPHGMLLLEHGQGQAEHVRTLLRSAGFADVHSVSDLAGIERVCMGTLGTHPRKSTD